MHVHRYCIIGTHWPCLPSAEWAAWVQAGGSLLALGVAVAIPVLIRRADLERAIEEKRIRARSYALALLPHFEAYVARVRQVRWRLRDEDVDDLEAVAGLLEMPSSLTASIIDVHELGSVGSAIQDALALAPKLKQLIDETDYYWRHGGLYFDHEGNEFDLPKPDELNPVVEQTSDAFERALSELRALFGG